MKKISAWAKRNINKARFIIVLIKLVLIAMACYVGITLYKIQVELPAGIIYTSVTLLALFAIALYPSKKNRGPAAKFVYLRQKSCDFTLAACSFAMIATMTNTPGTYIKPVAESYGSSILIKHRPTAAEILNSLKTRDKASLTHLEKRILKKEFFKQLKIYGLAKVTGDKKKIDDSLLILLTIIGAIGLAILLAALVCNLSCSGADTAAAIVGILGLGLIIWGVVLVINRISRKPKPSAE
jgi:hypothetical protein